MTTTMIEQITLEAPAPLLFSEPMGEEMRSERPARLLEAGTYPDKDLTLTTDDLDEIVARFSAGDVPVKVEHLDSPLDPLGTVRRVWREGTALLATLAFPDDLAGFLRRRGAAKLSVGLAREPLALREVSLVLKPRVATATLMAEDTHGAEDTHRAEVVRLRAELVSREVEAHLAAFKAQGRIVPASEAPARALLASAGEATVTLSDGPEPIARVFRRFLEAQPPVVLLSEVAPSGPEGGSPKEFTQSEHTFLWERLGVDPARVAALLREEREAKKQWEKGEGDAH